MTEQEHLSSQEEEELAAPNTETSTEEQGEEEAPKGEEETPEEPKVPEENPLDDEPPVRKSPQEFILQRKAQQLEKERKRREELEQELADLRSKQDDTSSEEELSDAAKEILEKVHQEKTDLEIRNFLLDNPNFKPYEKKMQQWSKNPAYTSIPIQQLAYLVAGPDLMQLGAKMTQEADKKAQVNSTASGGMIGDTPRAKNVWDMTTEEFAQYQEQIMRRA